LQKACEQGRVAELPGFGETTQQKICEAIARRASHVGSFQFGQVAAEAEALRSDLAAHEAALQVEIAVVIGGERKSSTISICWCHKGTGSDYEILHIASARRIRNRARADKIECAAAFWSAVRSASSHDGGIPVRARLLSPATRNTTSRCGSRALQRGWTLNEYRLAAIPVDPDAKKKKLPSKIPSVRDEADLYRAVDLDFIPPELRENCGEFKAAEEHSLPKLIEKKICAAPSIAIPWRAMVTTHSKK
jgi:DNA polymerase (family 10)